MRVDDFDYALPPELIATHPAPQRDASRLLHVRRDVPGFEHCAFRDLPRLLRPGDCLVLNDSRVIPARLHALRPSGGVCELLLLEPRGEGVWDVMVRPARKLHAGTCLELPGEGGRAEVLAETGERTRLMRFAVPGDLLEYLERQGEPPLPPYILHQRKARGEEPTAAPEDRRRYQTIYAQPPGSIAAPTAGLHFTEELLARLREREVEIRSVTLHVGAGTFEPVTAEAVESHVMHRESYDIRTGEADAIERVRLDPGRRIVAVGTTVARTLESCFLAQGRIAPGRASTQLFVYPGFEFHVVEALVTNFHLPRSTLLMLAAAFAGRERMLDAYREAIERRYRFYSYGDAMLIE